MRVGGRPASLSCHFAADSRDVAEVIDKCIGSRIHIIMKSEREFTGTLLGFDDFVSIRCSCRHPAARAMAFSFLRAVISVLVVVVAFFVVVLFFSLLHFPLLFSVFAADD